MKIVHTILLFTLFMLSAPALYAQYLPAQPDEEMGSTTANTTTTLKDEAPVGMEFITVGDGNKLIVPKGAKIKQTGGQIQVEDTTEYFARLMVEMNARMAKLEQAQTAYQEELTALRQMILELRVKIGAQAKVETEEKADEEASTEETNDETTVGNVTDESEATKGIESDE
jgi:hypothetical protein